MVNYQNGKIYKIESHLGDKVYVGSTTKEYLSQRLVKHRADYNRWKSGKFNNISSFKLFDEYGIENCNIILLELYPCNSKDELYTREAHFIKTLNSVNKMIPNRTDKEYYNDNKEVILEKRKVYDKINKEKVQAHKKDYYQENKSTFIGKSKIYREANIDAIHERKKVYYATHKDQIKEKAKEYREANKEKSKAYRDENKDEINRKRREKAAAKKLEQQSS